MKGTTYTNNFAMVLGNGVDAAVTKSGLFGPSERELRIRFDTVHDIDRLIHKLNEHRRRVVEGAVWGK